MTLAALGAAAVFVLIFDYVDGVSRQVGPVTTAYEFARAVPRLQPVTEDDLKPVSVPEQWLPAAALKAYTARAGLVAASNIPQGAILQDGMLTAPPELKPGQQEIAILIDAETGVAGKVKAGDLVDIYATFSDDENAQARVIVTNAQVLAIGSLQSVDQVNAGADGKQLQEGEVVPVTFALTVGESLRITYAESYATKVRLALVAPGTRSMADPRTDILRRPDILGPSPSPSPTPRPAPSSKARSGR
jgi:pilus assembly protein CpaB